MNRTPIWIGMILGSFLGGLIPTLFGAGSISIASVVGSVVGGFAGIYLGYKISRRYF